MLVAEVNLLTLLLSTTCAMFVTVRNQNLLQSVEDCSKVLTIV